MTLLFRYLSGQILASFGLALTALLLLFGIFDLMNELDSLRDDYTVGRAVIYVLLSMPGRAQELLPIAALLGAIFALARLAATSEFTVMRASGLSTGRLVGYMAALGLLLGVATLLVGEYLTPPAERLAQQIKIRSTTGIVAQQFRSGLWAKDGGTFINIRQMRPDTSLVDVRMYEFDDAFRLLRIRIARTANWSDSGHWQLHDVTDTSLGETGTQVVRRPELDWQSPISPDLLSVLMVNPDRMAVSTLYSYISYLNANHQKATRYEIALWSKLASPLAAPVMLLLALPFAYQQARGGKIGNRVLLGILIGLGFHLINRMSGNLGLLNDWPPTLSALLPLTVFSIAALVALRRVETR
ncbi:LPS export ABC transporter permease LptG [Parasulfuritortus cantonensis]|uniref:LPS export ABC transporter permease LptG n=1 Tax=Parasulfuritortus cantonensis TaxID=2528202 RepID=A0A4R1BQG6_9PROT|nr:LPS export ABC transporter permease LptG [Parasulfuritortus cantonensis]TCJ19527.1 LPS export ABC transporter permease LptG [Parasulfuritortus cantonensis]